MGRRNFIINNTLVAAGLSFFPTSIFPSEVSMFKDDFKTNRPPKEKRTFISKAVEELINEENQKYWTPNRRGYLKIAIQIHSIQPWTMK